MASSLVAVAGEFPLHCTNEAALQGLRSPVPLGPLDQRSLLSIPLAVVFVYRRSNRPNEVVPIDKLRAALTRLLDYYPHLTGRIVVDPKNQSPQIEQLGVGAKLVSARCSEPITAFEFASEEDKPGSAPRLIGTKLPNGGNDLLPPFDPTEAGAARDAILTVQHTLFACGGVSIGLRVRHIICDASGFFQLARDLAELYRGIGDLDPNQLTEVVLSSSPPDIHSYMSELRMTPEERQEALQIRPTLFELAPECLPSASSTKRVPIVLPTIGKMLRFTSNELSAIKAEANAGGNALHPVSTFCALAAHMWQSIYRAHMRLCEHQGMSPNEAALYAPRQFLASVDLRSRGQLDVPPRYFPNCVLCPVFSLPASGLLSAPLSSISFAVHSGVQPLDRTEVEQNVRWVAAQPDKQRVRLRYKYHEGGVMVSQWNKFGMYQGTELDVAPSLVFQPFTPISLIDGLMYFMSTEDQVCQAEASAGGTTGSIDVSLALSESTWKVLEQDSNFRRHRGW
ncbi:unnamed protein product [Phytophthora fragariaefolia]|uniref:Unnamed protein product n=1 Tax=Phytophthora fragariaefolia TaxID=1490495 RepID=A0A9W7CVE3_9STRA|nr:unnamed protein product [Phytophthora fragariaefolia]